MRRSRRPPYWSPPRPSQHLYWLWHGLARAAGRLHRRWEPRGLDWRLAVGRVLRHHEEEAALLRRILGTSGDGAGTEAADAS